MEDEMVLAWIERPGVRCIVCSIHSRMGLRGDGDYESEPVDDCISCPVGRRLRRWRLVRVHWCSYG